MKLEDGQWALVYSNRDFDLANEFLGGLR
jgi:Piwi domain